MARSHKGAGMAVSAGKTRTLCAGGQMPAAPQAVLALTHPQCGCPRLVSATKTWEQAALY